VRASEIVFLTDHLASILKAVSDCTAELSHMTNLKFCALKALRISVASIQRKPFSKEAIDYHVISPLARRLPRAGVRQIAVGSHT
jgi:hypothetical protein